MSDRPKMLPRVLPARLVLAAALPALAALAGCGSSERFPPACPHPVIQPDLADLTRYTPRGHDITDMVLDGEITGITGKCGPEAKGKLKITMQVGIRLTRGPASQDHTADVTYLVAVMRGDEIRNEQDFPLHIKFPPNAQTVDVTGDPIEIFLPTPRGVSGADYRIITGFKLTPEQLDVNHARGPR